MQPIRQLAVHKWPWQLKVKLLTSLSWDSQLCNQIIVLPIDSFLEIMFKWPWHLKVTTGEGGLGITALAFKWLFLIAKCGFWRYWLLPCKSWRYSVVQHWQGCHQIRNSTSFLLLVRIPVKLPIQSRLICSFSTSLFRKRDKECAASTLMVTADSIMLCLI